MKKETTPSVKKENEKGDYPFNEKRDYPFNEKRDYPFSEKKSEKGDYPFNEKKRMRKESIPSMKKVIILSLKHSYLLHQSKHIRSKHIKGSKERYLLLCFVLINSMFFGFCF